MTAPATNPFARQAVSDATIDKVVLLVVSGMSRSAIEEAAAKLGLEPGDAATALAEAHTRIQIAARWDRDEQLGTSLTRLNDIYRRALGVQDGKTALAAQREINKLLGLYTPHAKTAKGRPAESDHADPLGDLKVVG